MLRSHCSATTRAGDRPARALYEVSAENRFLHYVHLTTLVSAYAAAGRYADAYRLLDDNPVPLEDRRNDMALSSKARAHHAADRRQGQGGGSALGATSLARSEAAHGRRPSARTCARQPSAMPTTSST
jgi:LuxR family maltose regulon positive regulatory protein